MNANKTNKISANSLLRPCPNEFLQYCLLFVVCGMAFFAAQTLQAREVELSWEPFENALGYQVQIAKQPNFKPTLLQKSVKKPGLSTELDIGGYFYRVRAIDKDKQPGFWSEPLKFEVTPYPPELKGPKSESSYSFFEIPPKIDFEWKAVDGEPEYEIFIYRTTGKKAFEQRTKDVRISVDSLVEGEYMWKMRTIYKGIFESPYGEPRRFTVEKKDLATPLLISPEQNAQLPAYQDIALSWKKDDVAQYTDLAVSFKSEENGQVVKLDPGKNLTDTQWTIESSEPGDYKWRVRTKEGQNTKGTGSATGEFRVRKDMISSRNWGFTYGIGYLSKSQESKSTKIAGGAGKVQSSAFVNKIAGHYYVSQSVGLQFDTWHADAKQSDWSLPESGFTFSGRLRFGTPGFNQQLIVGYRQMNEYEILTEPSKMYSMYSTNGYVVGTGMNGTIANRYQLGIQLLYYKPSSYQENLGKLQGDVYEGTVSFQYNFSYKFWAGFELNHQQSTFQAGTRGQADHIKTSWDTTRTTPLVKLSFEN